MAVSNFFAFRTPSAHNNEAWGDYTMSMADHAPTCGWKLIVSSSYPLSSIAVSRGGERRDGQREREGGERGGERGGCEREGGGRGGRGTMGEIEKEAERD